MNIKNSLIKSVAIVGCLGVIGTGSLAYASERVDIDTNTKATQEVNMNARESVSNSGMVAPGASVSTYVTGATVGEISMMCNTNFVLTITEMNPDEITLVKQTYDNNKIVNSYKFNNWYSDRTYKVTLTNISNNNSLMSVSVNY